MTPRTFIGLAAVTAVVAAGAIYSAHERYATARTDRSEGILFPDLLSSVNDVAQLTIRGADQEVDIQRRDGTWVVVSKHGYPADGAKVREAIFGLSQLRGVEPKTRMPERYARLEVEDVSAEDAKSHLWILKDAEGATLAEVIVGKQRYDLGGVEARGVYVRKSGEAQSWLARGKLPVDQSLVQWMDRDVVDIRIKWAKRVTTIDAEGNELVAEKPAPGDEHFRLANLPEGFDLKDRWQWEVDGLGSALSGLDLDDVAPAESVDFSGPGVVRAKVETFGGLVVNVALVQQGEGSEAKWWATFEAAADANAGTPQTVAAADPPAAADAGAAAAEEKNAEAAADAPDRIRTPEEVAAEAKAINERLGGWAYQISDFKAKPLRLRYADLKAEPKEGNAS